MSKSPLEDRFGRVIDYLRLSVTDRCDLRCSYCMPKGFKGFHEPREWLNFDELTRLVGIFAALGVRRVRLTGGEPLLRRHLPVLAARIARIEGIEDVSVSTNATQLAKHAAALREAGVERLNISLDSLQADRIASITGRDCLGDILEGLAVAKACGFSPIKINVVAMRGVNDDEIDAMTDFCIQHGFVLRFIETMPLGETGRNARHLDVQGIRKHLQRRFNLVDGLSKGGGPARYSQSAAGDFSVGFITPISQHFCDTCNRVRLAVDGALYTCLGDENFLALRPLLRGGATDLAIAHAIRNAVDQKPERHLFNQQPQKVVRFMSATGG